MNWYWRCNVCGRTRMVRLRVHEFASVGSDLVLAAHRATSPHCPGGRDDVRVSMKPLKALTPSPTRPPARSR